MVWLVIGMSVGHSSGYNVIHLVAERDLMSTHRHFLVFMKYFFILMVSITFLNSCATKGKSPRYYHHSYHTVAKGETLYSISFKYGVSMKELAAWNRISEPYVIYPGQKLRLNSSAVAQKSSRYTKESKSTANKSPPKNVKPVGQWGWPLSGKVIEEFSSKNNGINIVAKEGSEVKAAASGKVVYAGDALRGYGNLIIIKHNSSIFSAYAHNKKLLVKEEDTIAIGQPIALLGSTEADRVMLHFEIRKDGNPVNPRKYLP